MLKQIRNSSFELEYQLVKILFLTGCVDTEEADIYFLIDGSSSLDYFDFLDLKFFLKEVVKLFTTGPNKVRFGVVQYSQISELEFGLQDYVKTSEILKAIDNIRQIGGRPYTGAALTFIQSLLKRAQDQHSRRVPCHLIVLTDRESEDHVKEPARKLRKQMVNIYAIGLRQANESQIYDITESKDRVYFVNDFASLKHIKNEVVQDICAVDGKNDKITINNLNNKNYYNDPYYNDITMTPVTKEWFFKYVSRAFTSDRFGLGQGSKQPLDFCMYPEVDRSWLMTQYGSLEAILRQDADVSKLLKT